MFSVLFSSLLWPLLAALGGLISALLVNAFNLNL